jgi:thiosulfate/3-mercaptopyruvate sulfurtransferase
MTQWKAPGIALLVAASLVGGCGQEGTQETAASDSPAVRSELLVEADWLAQRLDDPSVVVVHVASNRGEYEAGHVPGARFLPLSALIEEREGIINLLPAPESIAASFADVGVSGTSHVVLYGAPLFAARGFMALEHIGHPRASLLNGALPAWEAAGHPLSQDPVEYAAGDLRARPTDTVVDAEWVLNRLDDPEFALLDARPPAQFTGEDPGDRVPRPGHIPGAENVFWERMILSSADPRLQDEASLRAMLAEGGATPDRTVVTYCRTGFQASFAYFVSRYLGLDAKVYDGSFVDWSPREELPVVAGE